MPYTKDTFHKTPFAVLTQNYLIVTTQLLPLPVRVNIIIKEKNGALLGLSQSVLILKMCQS